MERAADRLPLVAVGGLPEPAREAEQADLEAIREFGWWRSLACYFDRWGLLADWYWKPGCHGRVWNLFHGRGWRIG